MRVWILSIFKDFDLVVSGHFHQSSRAGVIQYLGAPYQMTWADAGCARGFWILDTETLDMKFIQNRNDMYVIDPEGYNVKNKFVKVIVKEKGLGFDNYIKTLEENGAIEVKVIEPGTDLTTNIEIDAAKYDLDSPTKIFHDYVAGSPYDEKIYNKQKLRVYSCGGSYRGFDIMIEGGVIDNAADFDSEDCRFDSYPSNHLKFRLIF